MATATGPLLDAALAQRTAEEAESRALARYSPAPHLEYLEWAEKHRHFPPSSPYPGPIRFDLTPYLREPLRALADPNVEEITVLKCTQAGATESLLLTVLLYHIDQDPLPELCIIPSSDEAKKWSKSKLAPAIAETPPLVDKVADPKSRSSDNTILEKVFPGGSLGIVGSNSPRGFRMRSSAVVCGDDVDGWDKTAGTEGDQITLARRRADRFPNRRFVWISTPTDVGSRTHRLYMRSQSRGRYAVPCPSCGKFQVLEWGDRERVLRGDMSQPKTKYGLKWKKGKPETAAYMCKHCRELISERHKGKMVLAGRYVDENNEPIERALTMGFWFNALVVLLAGSEWGKLAEEWMTVHHDPAERKSFANTVLTLSWEPLEVEVTVEELEKRRENWRAEVPNGVGILSMAVDVQQSWVEVAVWGWGEGEECWLVYHERVQGDPEHQETFGAVEALRTREWLHESGRKVRIWPAAIDAGYKPNEVVYPYVRGKEGRGTYAMFGEGRAKSVLTRSKKPNDYGVRPWTVAPDPFKDTLLDRLTLTKPGPGYIHLPHAFDMGADAEFVAQFGAEIREEAVLRGKQIKRFKQIRKRNEAIDLYVLGLAALHTLGPTVLATLGDRAREWSGELKTEQREEPTPTRRTGSSWVSRYRR